MKKKFVSNLLLVLVLNIIIKPIYILGIDAEVLKITEQSDPGSYGIYFSLLSLSFVFNILLDMGVNTFNTRNIAQNNKLFYKYFSKLFNLKIFLGILYLLTIISVGKFLNYSNHNIKLLILIGFNQILIAFILFLRSNLSALLRFKEDSIISVADRTILILFCGYFLWAKTTQNIITIEFFILSQTLAYLITLILAMIFLPRKSFVLKIKWNLKFNFIIVKKSLPYALLIFLMSIYYYSDVVMIEKLRGNVEASAYAHGYRFFMAFNMIGVLFAGLLLPTFSKLINEKSNISRITWLSFKLMFLCAIIIGVSVWTNKLEIIKWRYNLSGLSLLHSSETFGWLIISFIAVSLNYIFGTLLTANGKLKPINILATIAVIINISMNLILIPKFGSTGAAFSSMITQFFTLFFQIYFCYKIFPNNVRIRSYIKLLLFIILYIIIIFTVNYNINYDWYLKLSIYLTIGIVNGFLLNIINIKDLKLFVNSAKMKN